MSRPGASRRKTKSIDVYLQQASDYLRRSVISRILKVREKPEQLRAWVVGSSASELVYLLTILLLEAAASDHPCDVQVFATHLEDGALDQARKGIFPVAIESTLDSHLLHRFFEKEIDGYRVRPEVRDSVLFLRHDLIKDAPFMGLDLILCQQPLNHLDEELQKRAYRILHSASLPEGYLLLEDRLAGCLIDHFFRTVDHQRLPGVDAGSSLLLLAPKEIPQFAPDRSAQQPLPTKKQEEQQLAGTPAVSRNLRSDLLDGHEPFILDDPDKHTPLERYLASELNRTRELLHNTYKHLNSSRTELQSATDSLAQVGAELKVTKAELRSVQYELRVLKESLRSRVKDLRLANQCLEKTIYLTDLAAIFLDGDYRLLSYTPAVESLFCLSPLDIGIPIDQIQHGLDSSRLLDDAARVFKTGASIQSEVQNTDGRWFLVRISRFQTNKNSATGVVISFIDVTHLKEASILLEEATVRHGQIMAEKAAELQQKEEELKREEKKRKELQRRVSEISNERQRILGEQLHDSLAQLLSGTRMLAKSLHLRLERNKKIEARDLQELLNYLESAEKEAEDLARGLLPVRFDSSAGLVASLETLVQRTCNLWRDVDCRLEVEPTVDLREELPAMKLYYIAQEALNNALKHGQASLIIIRLRKDSRHRLVLEIDDNGRGIRKGDLRKARGVGIQIMRHRAELIDAQLRISRKKEGGTLVRCTYHPQAK